MIADNWPNFSKFLKNIIARLDIIGVSAEDATRNYVNNIDPSVKEALIKETEEFLGSVDENLDSYNELAWRSVNADQARDYMSRLLEVMKTSTPW